MANAVLPELRTIPSTSNTRSSSPENHSELTGGLGWNGLAVDPMLESVEVFWVVVVGKMWWSGFGDSRIDMDFCLHTFLENVGWFLGFSTICHRFLQLQFDRLVNLAIRSSSRTSPTKNLRETTLAASQNIWDFSAPCWRLLFCKEIVFFMYF